MILYLITRSALDWVYSFPASEEACVRRQAGSDVGRWCGVTETFDDRARLTIYRTFRVNLDQATGDTRESLIAKLQNREPTNPCFLHDFGYENFGPDIGDNVGLLAIFAEYDADYVTLFVDANGEVLHSEVYECPRTLGAPYGPAETESDPQSAAPAAVRVFE